QTDSPCCVPTYRRTPSAMALLPPTLPFCRAFGLAPGRELLEPEAGQRARQRATARLVPPGQAIVLLHQVGQPPGDGEALVLAVGDRLQEARPHVGPVVLRAPAALAAEQALQDDGAVAG